MTKEQKAAHWKKYYEKNKEKLKSKAAEYRKNNPDKIKENNKKGYTKKYREENEHFIISVGVSEC